MYNFCTLFDSNYLTRGLALYESLIKNCEDFHLYIFPFDELSYQVLERLNLPKVTLIPLIEFEDKELLKVKPNRNRAEYCWTCTSSTILYVLDNFNVDMCTYIDADILFYSSPKPIFDEISNSSILLTEHRYSPKYNKEVKSGKYCVQFVTFRNDYNGLIALKWWRERCIEWCYDYYEDGKFGDQLYLDDWTERFKGVHVLKHLGGGIAAWNVQQYSFSKINNTIYGVEKSKQEVLNKPNKFEVIFYHFHYLRLLKSTDSEPLDQRKVELGRRLLSEEVIEIFYKPYLSTLIFYSNQLNELKPDIDFNGSRKVDFSWKTPIIYIYRKVFGIYNIFKICKLLPNFEVSSKPTEKVSGKKEFISDKD